MFVILFRLFVLYNILLLNDARHLHRRRRRQTDDSDEDEEENYLLPPHISTNPYPSGNRPFPGRKASNLYPEFPLSHQFSNGFDVNPGTIAYLNGNLNIPDAETGQVFDLKGKLSGGQSHTWFNYGHLIQPVNTLNVSQSALSAMVNDPEFQAARASAPIVPVAQLPSGWRPVHCKPPLCNPFVHTADMGVQIEPGDDGWVDGSIDFPILRGENAGRRFPFSGAVYAGSQPIYFVYGHHINPVNPFPGQVSSSAGQTPGTSSTGAKVPFRPFTPTNSQIPPSTPNQGPSLVLPPNTPERASDAPPFVLSKNLPPLPPLPPSLSG